MFSTSPPLLDQVVLELVFLGRSRASQVWGTEPLSLSSASILFSLVIFSTASSGMTATSQSPWVSAEVQVNLQHSSPLAGFPQDSSAAYRGQLV